MHATKAQRFANVCVVRHNAPLPTGTLSGSGTPRDIGIGGLQ
jgi:hypothetical protein